MKDEDKKLIEIWKAISPDLAYMSGFTDCAGQVFISSRENIETWQRRIDDLMDVTEDLVMQRVLRSFHESLNFQEPYIAPQSAIWTIFYHFVKGRMENKGELERLMGGIDRSLKASMETLDKEWSTVHRVLTAQHCNSLNSVIGQIESTIPELAGVCRIVKSTVSRYRKTFGVDLETGDFKEVYPLLEREGGEVWREKIYPVVVEDIYAYPESITEIEERAMAYVSAEMPLFRKAIEQFAEIMNVETTMESISRAMVREMKRPHGDLLSMVQKMRSLTRPFMERHLVRISPNYCTELVETPDYLRPMLPSAAMTHLDGFLERPFNLYFFTTDERWSPPSTFGEAFHVTVHEEFGHCVNFSNSYTDFVVSVPPSELINQYFMRAISDGISFYRELETYILLRGLLEGEMEKADRSLLNFLSQENGVEKFLAELEFLVYKWRILRFLRALGDVWINTGKMGFDAFIEWAHQRTSIDRKLIYDQLFIFQGMVGYAPSYSMAGERIREIQKRLVEGGTSVLEFNTYAASMGFPPREVFERRLLEFY